MCPEFVAVGDSLAEAGPQPPHLRRPCTDEYSRFDAIGVQGVETGANVPCRIVDAVSHHGTRVVQVPAQTYEVDRSDPIRQFVGENPEPRQWISRTLQNGRGPADEVQHIPPTQPRVDNATQHQTSPVIRALFP